MFFGNRSKKISDLTVDDLFTAWLIQDIFRNLADVFHTHQENKRLKAEHAAAVEAERLRQEEVMKKSRGVGFEWTYENVALLRDIRMMKQMGGTPEEGWDHYRQLEPWLNEVKVEEKHMHETTDWPSWMVKRPAKPVNWMGRPWCAKYEK